MARTYGKLFTTMWRPESEYRLLTVGEQWLYEALISQPDLSHAGVIAYRPARWARLAANTTPESVIKLVEMLTEKRYLLVDMDTEEVLLRTFIRHDGGGNNPKMRKAISTAIALIESPTLQRTAAAELAAFTAGQSGSDHQSGHQSDTRSDRDTDGDAIGNPIPSSSNLHLQLDNSSSSTARYLHGLKIPDAAVEALLLLCEFRIKTSRTTIDNPGAYCRTIIDDELEAQRHAIVAAAERGDSPETIADALLGVAAKKVTKHAWYADPHCEECPGDGWASSTAGAIPCECRRPEPYMATVHQLRGESA